MKLTVKRPTLIVFPGGDRRIADFVFPHLEGACFVEIWWDRPEAHPFHVLTGEIKQIDEESWEVGDLLLRPLTEDDPEWREWQRWLDYRDHGGGSYLTDNMALEAARLDGAIIED